MTSENPPIGSRWRPLFLLCAFGVLMGFVAPLAKLSEQAGLSGQALAFWQALGGGVLILLVCRNRRQAIPLGGRHLRYYALAGLTGIALPNLAAYVAVPQLGAGLTSLAYVFPPLFTLGLALFLGMERFEPRRAGGIALGFLGTLMIALPQQGGLPVTVSPLWLVVALTVPLSLAIGNVYRSRHWPAGAEPLPLAAGMLLGGAAELSVLLPLAPGSLPHTATAFAVLLAVIALTAVAYMMFLELQRLAGAVYLSQVGFVITPTGFLVGVLLLGEHYGPWIWAAVATVFLGVALTNRSLVAD